VYKFVINSVSNLEISPHKLRRAGDGVLDMGYLFPNNIPRQVRCMYVNFALWRRNSLSDAESAYYTVIPPPSRVSIVTKLRDGPPRNWGFDSRQRQKISLLSILSRPALQPIQLHMQWVTGVVSTQVNLSGREAKHSSSFSAEVKNECSYRTSIFVLTAWRLILLAQGQFYFFPKIHFVL
jgi:hypothetical protein